MTQMSAFRIYFVAEARNHLLLSVFIEKCLPKQPHDVAGSSLTEAQFQSTFMLKTKKTIRKNRYT